MPSRPGSTFSTSSDTRTSTQFQLYTFANTAAYLAARSGANPFGYNTFAQYFGEPDLDFSSNLYGLFVQDDWRLGDSLKLLYGLRYDLYDVPAPLADAPFAASRDFRVDTNNVAPRLGLVWTAGADRRTVVRVNTGLMYDQAILASYEQALINDGTNTRAAASFQPTSPGAPAFPNALSAGAGATPNTLTTVSPEFSVARNWQNNLQVERQLGDRFAVSLGGSYARGTRPARAQQRQRHQPDRPAGRRAADLQHGAERLDAARPPLQRHQHVPVDRRVDLQEPDGAGHRPPSVGHPVRPRLHARQE